MSKNVQKTIEKKLIGYKTHKLGLNKILSLGSLISHISGKKNELKFLIQGPSIMLCLLPWFPVQLS